LDDSRKAQGSSEKAESPQAVFLDLSGRRWKRLRLSGLVVAAVLVGLIGTAVPQTLASPALEGLSMAEGPTIAEVGADPPVIGSGPLIRVVRLLRDGAAVYAQDPFDGQVVAQLARREINVSGDAEYALQRYGHEDSPYKTVSLTFDDGPDPVYTPKLLDVLAEHGVPATFFVTGAQAARYPELVRRIVREGHAIGNHSLTHVDVAEAPPFRQRLELVLSDRILRAETGQYASFFRLPYESFAESSMQDDVRAILRAQQLGYVVASHDFDPKDWAYASGELTGQMPLPPLGERDHFTVLLHDAGGADRTLTIEYVEKLIPLAHAADYVFASMPAVHAELAERTGPAEVTVWDRAAVVVAHVVFVLPAGLLWGLLVLAVVSMAGLGLLYAGLALVRSRQRPRGAAPDIPGVSVVIAAYNEEAVIARTIHHVLASAHHVNEIIVVDDGSVDVTASVVRRMAAADR
jgi:peptidoglycan/xylan/chitin deacetylase (PgdA/CDA1 family)